MTVDVDRISQAVAERSVAIRRLRDEISAVIVGQRYMIERLIVGLLTGGHVLLEGVPGLAKTLTVETLARSVNLSFKRLQFTPDLLPADLIGTLIYNPNSATFTPRKGPIFASIVLADEINRAPAKVQSALLEAMQEHHVTIGDETYPLEEPFLVLATQNPIEQQGTYPLPEAQVDRFMLKLRVGYPTKVEEREILERVARTRWESPVQPVITGEDIFDARRVVDDIYMDDKIKDYIIELVHATRAPEAVGLQLGRLIEYGASPRATIGLTLAAKAWAFLDGRGYVTPQDVKSIAPDVMRHRVIVTYEAEAQELTSDSIVQQVLDHVPVP